VVGGVGLYINQNLKFEIVDEIKLNTFGVEELWIEIAGINSLKNSKRINSCIYRHPSQNSEEFLSKLNTYLAYLNSERKQF